MTEENNEYALPKSRINYWHFLKFVAILLLIFISAVAILGLWSWNRNRVLKNQMHEQVQIYLEAEDKYITAMSEDTYGGSTPQETLDLFVKALEEENIELASKYFLLDEETLDTEKWRQALEKAKEDGRLNDVVDIVSRAISKPDQQLNENDFKLETLNQAGELEGYINMQFNIVSKIWKIESL